MDARFRQAVTDQGREDGSAVEQFRLALATYRDQLGDPQFASDLDAESAEPERRLARLHAAAARQFELEAISLASRANAVDAYEQGAYGDPPVNGMLLGGLMFSTLGFSVAVLIVYGVVGIVLLAMSACLNVVLVHMWRRTPYRYTGEYRKRWDDAAAVASERSARANSGALP